MFKFLIVLIPTLWSVVAAAADDYPLGVSMYGSFLHTERIPNTLFFFSDVEENDSFELRKAIRNHSIETVVLSSRGGSVWEGLNMAGIIHDKGLNTYIPKKGLGAEGNCASACAFMFFGGKNRIADGKLGVHQFYSGSASKSANIGKSQEAAQFTVSEIIGFLNEFDTPPFVFERMFQQSDMYYFDSAEIEKITSIENKISRDERDRISNFIDALNLEVRRLKEDHNKQKPKSTPNELETSKITKHQLVREIQIQLNRLGCNAGPVDGKIGNKTISAAMKFTSLSDLKFSLDMLHQLDFLLALRNTSELNCGSSMSDALVSKQWADFNCAGDNTDTILITTQLTKNDTLEPNKYMFSGTFKTSQSIYTFSTLEQSPITAGKVQSTTFILRASFLNGNNRQYELRGRARLNSSGNYVTFGVSDGQGCRIRSGGEFF